MASFRTHVLGAALPSAAAAALALRGGLVDAEGALACAALGTLGGMLPDIDAEQSRPTRLLFGALGLAAAIGAVLALPAEPIGVRAAAALVALVVGNFGLRALTASLSVHRGMIHSLPVAALCGAALALAGWRLGGLSPARAWLGGLFLSGGFVIHLLLDELSSVDLGGARLRASFGTALKLGARRQLLLTALIYAALAGVVSVGPPLRALDRTSRALLGALGGSF